MLKDADRKVIWKILAASVGVFILVYLVIVPPSEMTLESIIEDVDVNQVKHPMGHIEFLPPDLNNTLPDISKYPPQVEKITSNYIEIFSSPEKAGSGTDGWLTEVAEDFNNAGIKIDGKPVSVRLRAIPSGLGADYITSGKYMPEAYTPSNDLGDKNPSSPRGRRQAQMD